MPTEFNSKNTSNSNSFWAERQPLARTTQNLLNRVENAQVNLNEVRRLARELKDTIHQAKENITPKK